MNDSGETVSQTSGSDYWHEQVGEGLTRRKIFMMKQKFSDFVKRFSLLCAVSLSLSLAIILALPQMVFISYIAFFCLGVSFVVLYVSLIVFNYRLAKAFQKRAALWALLSLFFVPALFLYSWLMKKS
jgi:hypothetical protein